MKTTLSRKGWDVEVTRDVTNSNSSCSLGQLYYMYALHLQQLKVIQSSTQMQHLSHLVEFPVTPAFGQRLQDNYSPVQLRVQRKGCKKIKKKKNFVKPVRIFVLWFCVMMLKILIFHNVLHNNLYSFAVCTTHCFWLKTATW